MSIIEKKIKIEGCKGKRYVMALFDSGSTYSCIGPTIANKLEKVGNLPHPMKLSMAKKGNTIIVEKRVILDFYIGKYRFSDEFILIPGLSEEVIIGAKTMQAWRMKIDFKKEDIIIDPEVTKLRLMHFYIRRFH